MELGQMVRIKSKEIPWMTGQIGPITKIEQYPEYLAYWVGEYHYPFQAVALTVIKEE